MSAWKELHVQTAGLRQPAVLRNFFGTPPIDEMEIVQIFRRIAARHNGQLMTTLRAYQGGRREELEYRVLTSPPTQLATLQSWYDATFRGKPSALILNRAERWSADVANLAATINDALAGGDISRLHDAECVLFIGDYGFSPFGVHLDHDSTKVIHIPLASTPKTMFLWSKTEFQQATGSSEPCFAPESILRNAERYEFRVGDVFFLPADRYHVGHSASLTATLAIVLTHHNRPHHLDSLASALSARFGESWASSDTVRSLRFDELTHLAEQHHLLRRASNLGLSASIEYEAAALPHDHDLEFRVVEPFRIHHHMHGGVAVHARGTNFFVKASTNERHLQDIRTLFEVINTGEVLTVNLVTHIVRTLHSDAVAHLIDMLVRRHVVAC